MHTVLYCFNIHMKINVSPTYHQVHLEAVVELQSRYVVGLLKIMNHEQLSVLEASCAPKKLLQTFLKHKPKTHTF